MTANTTALARQLFDKISDMETPISRARSYFNVIAMAAVSDLTDDDGDIAAVALEAIKLLDEAERIRGEAFTIAHGPAFEGRQ